MDKYHIGYMEAMKRPLNGAVEGFLASGVVREALPLEKPQEEGFWGYVGVFLLAGLATFLLLFI